MKKILLALMIMFSVVGHTQTDISIEVEDTTNEHPDLEEFYLSKSFTNMITFTSCYANKKHGEAKLYEDIVVKQYHKATSNLEVNAETNKQINAYRKALGLSRVATESILSETIVSNHQSTIINLLYEFDRQPIVMWLITEKPNCECSKSIFDDFFDYPDIVDVIRDPSLVFFDVSYYQVSKGGKRLSSYSILTYKIGAWDEQLFMIEHEQETK